MENWLCLCQRVSITNSFLVRGGPWCQLPLSVLRHCLTWTCVGHVCDAIVFASSFVHQSCCVGKMDDSESSTASGSKFFPPVLMDSYLRVNWQISQQLWCLKKYLQQADLCEFKPAWFIERYPVSKTKNNQTITITTTSKPKKQKVKKYSLIILFSF